MQVAIIIGSKSDKEAMQPALALLTDWSISSEMRVLSAHRTPEALEVYLAQCHEQNVQVFICAAGMAAHLAGAVAARTTRPVIGVPMEGKMMGLDSLLSTAQMPPGIPVATVAVGGAKNAAILAAQILALNDIRIGLRLKELRVKMRDDTLG